jgi:hypothetical protein
MAKISARSSLGCNIYVVGPGSESNIDRGFEVEFTQNLAQGLEAFGRRPSGVVAAVGLARKKPGEVLRNHFPAARIGSPTSGITGVRNYIANQFSALAKTVSRGPPLRY